MTDVSATWKAALPQVQNSVTGRGVWAALNAAQPIAYENNVFVIGLPPQDNELSGHLKIASTKRLMEMSLSQQLGSNVSVRIIDGTTAEDYEIVKRRDSERRRMEDAEMAKMRAELASKSNWESVYEQLSRRFSAVTNKSLPQNRARFFEEAVEIVAEARRGQTVYDDLGERNFARCLERLAQYSEVPSVLVARAVLERAGEL
jgi:hypothetical protein